MKVKRQIVLWLVLVWCVCVCATAQRYECWVGFTDKNHSHYTLQQASEILSERALQRRARQHIALDESDLPVSAAYLDSLRSAGCTIVGVSKWLNGATVSVNDTVGLFYALRSKAYVREVELTKVIGGAASTLQRKHKLAVDGIAAKALHTSDLSQYRMLGIDGLHQRGFEGTGVHVAVLDGGFLNVDNLEAFASLRSEGRLLGARDFVGASYDLFRREVHGTAVLSTMASNLPDALVGGAPKASYWLLRTEDVESETLSEIDNWVRAIEFADSVGVDVVNSSLGYSVFDDDAMNFTYAQLDGITTRISKAATMAARKGMVVVNSMGNDGSGAWHYLSAPADADSIVSVGAVTDIGVRSAFSSFGPASDGRVKPTLCALGSDVWVLVGDGTPFQSNGTSFAAPIVASAITCLWGALPEMTNMQIIDLLVQSASQSDAPDNELGYGVPNAFSAYCGVLQGVEQVQGTASVAVRQLGERIKVCGAKHVRVYDVYGRLLFASEVEGDGELSTTSWHQGVYCVVAQGLDGEVCVQKVVKQ